MAKSAAHQLTLLSPPHPWETRFGPALFRRIPARPGVYFLGDGQGGLLYVGKALNLRRRLLSYKNLPVARCSRKTARLLQETKAIAWEVLPHGEAALLRENELLRCCKPKYNQLNTRPELYVRVAVAMEGEGRLRLRWEHGSPPPSEVEGWHGAFKGPARLQESLRALARLCVIIGQRPATLHDLPHLAYQEKLPRDILLAPLPPPLDQAGLWRDFFAGRHPGLLEALRAALPDGLPPPLQRLADRDLVRLEAFFGAGPARNRRLCERAGLPGAWLAPEELDDLLALEQAAREKAMNNK